MAGNAAWSMTLVFMTAAANQISERLTPMIGASGHFSADSLNTPRSRQTSQTHAIAIG